VGVNNIVEYYIHYVNFNKRLDEWVPVTRMNVNTAIIPKEAKKDTKRKAGKGKAPSTAAGSSLNATLLASAEKLPIVTADFAVADTKSGIY
jgi:histone acetyltransferase HTATIP